MRLRLSLTSSSPSPPKSPDMLTAALITIIVLALVFDYTNGFHDAANAIASAISTRALTPRVALIIAAVANLGGALLSTGVAVTIAKSIIDPPSGPEGLAVVLAALVGAIAWNFTTWYFGLPSSSSQALIGGLVGAGIASRSTVHWSTGVVGKVIIPMILSPAVGLLGGYLLMVIALWVFRRPIHIGWTVGSVLHRSSPRPAWRSAMACRMPKRAWASSCSLW
jgi:inorganic phosphate transporter, PiT family